MYADQVNKKLIHNVNSKHYAK